jgi:hypothetical protein
MVMLPVDWGVESGTGRKSDIAAARHDVAVKGLE